MRCLCHLAIPGAYLQRSQKKKKCTLLMRRSLVAKDNFLKKYQYTYLTHRELVSMKQSSRNFKMQMLWYKVRWNELSALYFSYISVASTVALTWIVLILSRRAERAACFQGLCNESKSLKIVCGHSAPSCLRLLTHCGSILDYGGVLAPQVVAPVAICGFYSPYTS